MDIEKLAKELARVALSPIYDDDEIYEANQYTFMQQVQGGGFYEVARHVARMVVGARIEEIEETKKADFKVSYLVERGIELKSQLAKLKGERHD